ncbi:hypothetical protein HYV83_00820 [Candidatus Woesearchaeota archaeon]|nr:hypothetical protein [Candidatus Woesearchaeota archaeon]
MTRLGISKEYLPWMGSLAVIAIAAAMLFQITGLRTILASAIIFVGLPLILLRKTGLDGEEKIMFSLFIGLGLSSLAVWTVNRVLPSFRISIIAAFIIVAAVSIIAPKILHKN